MSLTNHADSAQYTGKLKYLVYTSIASPDLTEESVQSMLAAAREHNASAEITGLLLFRTGTFIQFLEGAAEEIDQLIVYPTFVHFSHKHGGPQRQQLLYNKSYRGRHVRTRK